jgi:hypothetical protein
MPNPDDSLKPSFSYHPSDTIFLIVGEAQEYMLVHAPYLSARSEFFRAALSKDWKEGQSRVIKLPEDDPSTVAQYLDFVYKDRLPTQRKWFPDQAKFMYFALAQLYVYGERVLDVVIRNTIVEHFVSFSSVVNRDLPTHPFYPDPAVVEMSTKVPRPLLRCADCWSTFMCGMGRRSGWCRSCTLPFIRMWRASLWAGSQR